jgi:Bacterial regulatory proteins, tetR family
MQRSEDDGRCDGHKAACLRVFAVHSPLDNVDILQNPRAAFEIDRAAFRQMERSLRPGEKHHAKLLTWDVVLDAAERLLQKGLAAEFSMRALAAEAGVGFATLFNHFGNTNAIMQALSFRVIGRVPARFNAEPPLGNVIGRVLTIGRIRVTLLLEQPEVYKAVVGSLGIVSVVPNSVPKDSQARLEQ